MRVARTTHRQIRERAAEDGVTVDEELRRLLRYDRQRRIAKALATTEPGNDEEQILRGSAAAVVRNLDAGR